MRLVEDAGDLDAIVGLETDHLALHKIGRVDLRERPRELPCLSGRHVADKQLCRSGPLGIEAHAVAVPGEEHARDAPLLEVRQRNGAEARGVEEPKVVARIVVDGCDEILPFARIAGADHVPIGAQDLRRLARGQVVAHEIVELRSLIRDVEEALAIQAEGLGLEGDLGVGHVAGVEQGRLAGGPVVEVEVDVIEARGLRQSYPAAVRGDGTWQEALLVLEQEGALEPVERHLINIESGWVSLVGHEEEASIVLRPPQEVGLELVARGQIADAAVRRLDVDVAVFVAPLVARVEEALVAREVAERSDGADLGLGELNRLAAGDRYGESIEGPGLVAPDQNLAAVRRERAAGVERGREKLLDRVAGDLTSRPIGPAGIQPGSRTVLRGSGAGESEGHQKANDRDAEEAIHTSLLGDERAHPLMGTPFRKTGPAPVRNEDEEASPLSGAGAGQGAACAR